ncbi:pilus assembly protein TadG-related protein [Falsihalocynthiibacter arcticus]|uniref:pilus assembly protein TadG-related protein n=1 Tax=Falsihalocynthiibacter arcticus TaxID=1579316 RepID=UPI0030021800
MSNRRSHIATFGQDQKGTILVFWGMALAVMLGLVAMSFDLGQVSITQTDMQSFTDNVALAAAGELDGSPDSITRATTAAANLIVDSRKFGSGDHTLSGADDFTLTFFSTLPASDTAAPTAITTNPALARFVRVAATEAEVPVAFYRALMVLRGETLQDINVQAQSIAGMTQFACDVTPMMFCQPSGWTSAANKGTMVNLRSGGNGAAWAPGNFGFLDPSKALVDSEGPCAGENGVKLDACLLAAVGSITQCYALNGVDTEPGQKNGIENAIFNVRFDIFQTILKSEKNNPNYAPAPNVIKGVVPSNGNACPNNYDPSPDTVGLPRDDCFNAGGCAGGRFGDGDWSAGYANYIATNYGGADPFFINPALDTRYDLYKAEIANPQGTSGNAGILPNGLAESGLPQCNTAGGASIGPERRVIVAAAFDCAANNIQGSAVNVPVAEFVEIFLTEPVAAVSSNTVDIWGEVIGPADQGSGAGATGIFRDVVQLYR